MGQNRVGSSCSIRSLYACRRCDTRPRLATVRVGASCVCVCVCGGGGSPVFTNVPWKRKLNIDLTLTCCCCLFGCDFQIVNCARLILIPTMLSWDFRTRVTQACHQHGYLAARVRGIDIKGVFKAVAWVQSCDRPCQICTGCSVPETMFSVVSYSFISARSRAGRWMCNSQRF